MENVINYINNHSIKEIILYFNKLKDKLLEKEDIDINFYKEEPFMEDLNLHMNYNTLLKNINEIIKLCNDLINELNYKYELIKLLKIFLNNYYSCNIVFNILNDNKIYITNDIILQYKEKKYIFINDKIIYDTININIHWDNNYKTRFNLYFQKNIIIHHLNIKLKNKSLKNIIEKQNNTLLNKYPLITIQLNGNYTINNITNDKKLIIIKQLTLIGNFHAFFINSISSLFQITQLFISKNNLLSLLYLNHNLTNFGFIIFNNINEDKEFKIILTNNKLEEYVIIIGNLSFNLSNRKYIILNNKIDFYL